MFRSFWKDRLNIPADNPREIIRQHNKYVSLRQSSEWSRRALQGTFISMKTRLPAIKRKCNLISIVIILLQNFRTHIVGLNQIATVFNVEYDAYVNTKLRQNRTIS